MRFLVLGAGAIGGYFGARLIEGGADVGFLVRERRKAQLQQTGIQVQSKFGAFSAPVLAVTAAEATKHSWDVIILTCKAYDLPSAIGSLKDVVGQKTAILPLLNGLSHIELLNTEFGKGKVLGGLAKIAATLRADGLIEHLNDWRSVTFGEQTGEMTPRVAEIKAAFDNTSVLARATPDIMHMMWEKVVHLATVAGMTSLMRSSVGEIARAPGGTELMIEFLARNAEVAALEGFPMSSDFFVEFTKLFHDKASTYKASMLRDIERNGPIEADHIIGYVLEATRKHGLDDTMHRLVYANLKAYEESRKTESVH